MTRPGSRFGVLTRPRHDDLARTGGLARKAVLVGALLAAAVVLLAGLTVVWSPAEAGVREASGVEGLLGPAVAKKDKSSDSKDSDSKDSKDSDSEDSEDGSGGDPSSDGSGHSKKKSGSSGKDGSSGKSGSSRRSGSSKSRSSDGDSDGSGTSSSPSSSGGSSSGAGPTGSAGPATAAPSERNRGPMVNISCTKEVTDEAGLKEALASAGPNDVICVKGGGLGKAPALTTDPTTKPTTDPTTDPTTKPTTDPTTRPTTRPTRSSPAPLGLAVPSGGPTSVCGRPEDCKQTNTRSGPSTRAGSPAGTADPASMGFTGPPGATTPKQDNCTKQVDGAALAQAVRGASPGDRICVTGDSADRLEITTGGTDQAPITVIGNGRTSVKGISVTASNVVVDGFQVVGAQAPGIELTGNNITAQNNTVKHPTGGDFDGMRFFGNNIKILHNTISDINPDGGKEHADCMQTFTSGKPSSEHVLIDGNRCERIANICLMAEGPGDVGDGGGGDGTSADWTFSNNFCEFGASQGVMVEAVQNVTIRNNQFEGKSDKAIGLDLGSTGAIVAANLLGGGIDHEVGMDSKSRQGYQGPQPQGGP